MGRIRNDEREIEKNLLRFGLPDAVRFVLAPVPSVPVETDNAL
jgi:hypothetical protein